MPVAPNQSVVVDGIELRCAVGGSGDPLLLVHGAQLVDGLAPVARHPAVADRCQVVRYHRRGMGGSGGRGVPATVARQAADAIGVLDALGIERAHVAGYSYGGVVALE